MTLGCRISPGAVVTKCVDDADSSEAWLELPVMGVPPTEVAELRRMARSRGGLTGLGFILGHEGLPPSHPSVPISDPKASV